MHYSASKRVVFCMILVGIADALYLLSSHYKNYTDLTYQSFCAISKAINCDTVSQSSWSIFLGIPLSLWGVLGYFFLFFLLLSPLFQESQKSSGWAVLLTISCLFSIHSIILAFISSYIIKSYCIMCILSYCANFFLFYISYRSFMKFYDLRFFDSLIRDIVFIKNSVFMKSVILFFIAVIIMIYSLMPQYWNMASPSISVSIKQGVEKDSRDPWIGAEKPVITIYEYTDYLCFQCRKMHKYLRGLVGANPEKIRLVHINYPMDNSFNPIIVPESFHEGSGQLALLSEYASEREDFWKINDALFEAARLRGEIQIDKISRMTGMSLNDVSLALHHPFFRKSLDFDILRGMKNRVLVTPSYIINGSVYQGIIPPDVFKQVGIK